MLRKLMVLVMLSLLLGMAACAGGGETVQTTLSTATVVTTAAATATTTGPTTVTTTAVATTTAAVTTTATTIAAPTTTNAATAELQPIVVPTLPADVPGYIEVDPATGLHMTGTPTVVDFASYTLKVSGKVAQELSLTYDELRLLPKMTARPDLVCEGYFVDTATWSGASLKTILEMAGVQPDATKVTMKSADGYSISIDLELALSPDNFLAYELMGQTLPVLQGFPLRAVLPGQSGGRWVKWLVEIVVG